MRPIKRELVNYTIPTADQNKLTVIEIIGDLIENNRKKYDLPPFYIAGGCIRDACIGIRPKDFDVFVPQVEGDLSYLSLYAEGFQYANPGGPREGNPYDSLPGAEEWSIDNYFSPFSPRPVQLIEKPFENGIDLIESFDYNVVKAFWTPEGFHFHPSFILGMTTKKVDVENDRSLSFARLAGWIKDTQDLRWAKTQIDMLVANSVANSNNFYTLAGKAY